MRKIDLHFSELQLFKMFRMSFGLFLFFHFFFLFDHLELLFSERLLAIDFAGSLNILSYLSEKPTLYLVNLMACILSLFLSTDFHRKTASFILLYIHCCYLHKNPMILNVSYDYLGWILLTLIFIPSENKQNTTNDWRIPTFILIGGWLIFGMGYSLNGILKLQSPFWSNGSALSIIIANDRLLANDSVKSALMELPPWMMMGLTWITAYAELLCLPLIAFRNGRLIVWFIILGLHLSALVIFKIKDLSLTMIFFSLLLGITLRRKSFKSI